MMNLPSQKSIRDRRIRAVQSTAGAPGARRLGVRTFGGARGALGSVLLAAGLVGTALSGAGPALADPASSAQDVARVEAEAQVVGNDGELLQLFTGPYVDLFADGIDAPADAAVLALESRLGDQVVRMLVPGTESRSPETSVRLIHDEAAGVTYLLWESVVNAIHPLIHLVAWDGSSWGEVREITGSVFSDKGHPQLTITRDSHAGPDGQRLDRTFLHVVWWEQTGTGVEKRYAPVVIENGTFLQTQVVRDLSAFFPRVGEQHGVDAAEGGVEDGFEPWALDRELRIQPGPTSQSTVMGFLDPGAGVLTSLRVEVLPQELSRLAATIAAELDALPETASIQAAEQRVRRTLDEAGGDLLPSTLAVLLDGLLDALSEEWSAEPGGRSRGEKLGARAVIVGMKIGANGLGDQNPSRLLGIGRGNLADDEAQFDHHLEVSLAGSWILPDEAAASSRLFLSDSGATALVAWPSDEGVTYQITLPDGSWSEAMAVGLSESLDLEGAMSLLERKALAR